MKCVLEKICAALMLLTIINQTSAQVVLVGLTGITDNFGPTARIVDINLTTGTATNPRDTGILLIGGIAVQPTTGYLFGLTTSPSSPANSLVRIDLSTGSPTLVGSTGLPNIVEGDLAFNPLNGLLYGMADLGAAGGHRNFFQVNPATGSASIIADLPNPANSTDYSSLAFDSNGILYCIDSPQGGPPVNSRLLTINPTTGAITSNITMNLKLGGGNGMAFDPDTGLAYVGDSTFPGTGLLYSLDVSSGFLTAIGPTSIPGGIVGLTAVPEPSSIAFLVVPALLIARRRKTLLKFWNFGSI